VSDTTRGVDALALLCDREALARLQQALRPAPAGGVAAPAGAAAGVAVHRVYRVAELRAALAERRWRVIVVEARDADRVPTAEAIRELRNLQPHAVVVGYARKTDLSSAILDFARAGVHELVVEGVDDGGLGLRAALGEAGRRATADRLVEAVSALVPPSFLPVVRYCLEHRHDASTVPDVARAFGITRQALVDRARRAALPPPRDLLLWCRLLLATRMLADRAGTVDAVAIELHFPSGNGLRNALRRHAGLTVQDVRRDGVAPVLRAFGEAIAAARGAAPEPASV
jgi:AraC-like DNA-binding protein